MNQSGLVVRQSFPLYERLLAKAKSDSLPVFDIGAICRTINSLKKEHAEIIYVMIYHHEICNSGKGIGFHLIPYKGKVVNNSTGGIIFAFNSLPNQLQHIIALYIEEIRSL